MKIHVEENEDKIKMAAAGETPTDLRKTGEEGFPGLPDFLNGLPHFRVSRPTSILVHVGRQTQSPLNCAWVAFVVTSSHKKMGKDKRSVLEKYMEAF